METMYAEGVIEAVSVGMTDKGPKFGIKMSGMDLWINGFGTVPIDANGNPYARGMTVKIPYHKIEKNGNTYFNYGAVKTKIDNETVINKIDELKVEMSNIKEALIAISLMIKEIRGQNESGKIYREQH